jgi:hypothetical protein
MRLHATRRGNIKTVAGMADVDYYRLRDIIQTSGT